LPFVRLLNDLVHLFIVTQHWSGDWLLVSLTQRAQGARG
jgi:hypothetical protein